MVVLGRSRKQQPHPPIDPAGTHKHPRQRLLPSLNHTFSLYIFHYSHSLFQISPPQFFLFYHDFGPTGCLHLLDLPLPFLLPVRHPSSSIHVPILPPSHSQPNRPTPAPSFLSKFPPPKHNFKSQSHTSFFFPMRYRRTQLSGTRMPSLRPARAADFGKVAKPVFITSRVR